MTVHLPTHQAAPISRGASPARPFRPGRRGLLRHAIDPVGRLRELENLLGVTLVERTRRRGSLHAARREDRGKGAARPSRDARNLTDMARAEGKPLHGELRLGVIPTIAPFLLPAMLPRLRGEWPNLKLFLREETSQAACDALHRGQLDCVLLAMPYAAATSTRPLCSTTACSSPSRAAKRRPTRSSSPARSTRTAC